MLVASTSGKKKTTNGKSPKRKTPPVKEWTEARKHSFIVSVLRAGTRRWPPKWQVLEEAKTEKKTNVSTGRMAQHYRCRLCLCEFPASTVEVDHITPVVGAGGFTTWDDYIENMFCDKDNLQVVCKPCHKIKSKQERGG